jgi:hypothetical protein
VYDMEESNKIDRLSKWLGAALHISQYNLGAEALDF